MVAVVRVLDRLAAAARLADAEAAAPRLKYEAMPARLVDVPANEVVTDRLVDGEVVYEAATDEVELLNAFRLNQASMSEVMLSRNNATARALEVIVLMEKMVGDVLVVDEEYVGSS